MTTDVTAYNRNYYREHHAGGNTRPYTRDHHAIKVNPDRVHTNPDYGCDHHCEHWDTCKAIIRDRTGAALPCQADTTPIAIVDRSPSSMISNFNCDVEIDMFAEVER
jgi:hypothetical protein